MSKANDLARLLNASGELQAADIEDGVITAAKLASTLDLSGKTVTYGLAGSDMPSGSVLQVVHATDTSHQTSSPGAWNWVTLGTWGTSITLSSASNKVLVMGGINVSSPGNQGQLQVRYSTNGGSTWTPFTGKTAGSFGTNCHGFIYDNNDSVYDSRNIPVFFLISPGATSFQVSARAAVDANSTINYNRTHSNADVGQKGPSNVVLMEIKA